MKNSDSTPKPKLDHLNKYTEMASKDPESTEEMLNEIKDKFEVQLSNPTSLESKLKCKYLEIASKDQASEISSVLIGMKDKFHPSVN